MRPGDGGQSSTLSAKERPVRKAGKGATKGVPKQQRLVPLPGQRRRPRAARLLLLCAAAGLGIPTVRIAFECAVLLGRNPVRDAPPVASSVEKEASGTCVPPTPTTARPSGRDPANPATAVWKDLLRNGGTSEGGLPPARIGIHVLRRGHPATKIVVLGERHSGTTFFERHLSECFPNTTVVDALFNRKHWFQPDPEHLARAIAMEGAGGGGVGGQHHRHHDDDHDDGSLPALWRRIAEQSTTSTNHDEQKHEHDPSGGSPPNHYFRDSLVVVLFRNPYDWVEAMRRKPWHWPNHLSLFPLSAKNSSVDVKNHGSASSAPGESRGGGVSVQKSYVGHGALDWKEFVERPLFLEQEPGPRDRAAAKPHEHGGNAGASGPGLCQKGYPPGTVSPCRRNTNYVPDRLGGIPPVFLRHLPCGANDPVYELRPGGQREPFEHLLQLRAAKIQNFLRIPEQWDLTAIGFVRYESLLGNGLGSLTEEIGRVLEGTGTSSSACPFLPPFEKTPYNISVEFRDWIERATRWDVESLIGYHRDPS